jgi:hypothetical protein
MHHGDVVGKSGENDPAGPGHPSSERLGWPTLLPMSPIPVVVITPTTAAGPSTADWLIAWGTIGLASVTVVALAATIWITLTDRRRDETARNADREAADDRLREEREAADSRLKKQLEHTERVARRSEQAAVTSNLIDEFFSDRFLAHRIAVSKMRRKVEDEGVPISEIAYGYWYPGPARDSYHGDLHGVFDEHQHLEAYIGYIVRLNEALRLDRIDKGRARDALGMHLLWHYPLLDQVARETVRQAKAANARIPSWTSAAEAVRQAIVDPYLLPPEEGAHEAEDNP